MLNDKNSTKISKFSKLLIGLTAFLTILYFLSFTKSCSSSDKREKIKTALVNQKYINQIETITLKDATGRIELVNCGNFWSVQNSADTMTRLPVSDEKINNFFNELTIIRNLYKISDKINKNSALGLTNGTEFHISYNISGSGSRELIFGNQDFSLSSRYMMTGENTQVYEIDDSMDVYLTTSIQSWTEPYIISREVLSTDIQTITATYTEDSNHKIKRLDGKSAEATKLLELRHGGLPAENQLQSANSSNPLLKLEIENGDKSSVSIKITTFDDQGNTYLVSAVYSDSNGYQIYNSYSTISSWTYNKIKEIML